MNNITENVKLRVNYFVTRVKNKVLARWLKLPVSEIAAGMHQAAAIEAIKQIRRLAPDKLSSVNYYHNLVPNVFLGEMAKRIGNVDTSTYTFIANKIALGDDGTAVDAADTALGNETKRSDFSVRDAIGSVAYLDKFFGSIEVGGSIIQEIGIFVDGAAGVGSAGLLLSHVNANETMAATESLTINATITVANG